MQILTDTDARDPQVAITINLILTREEWEKYGDPGNQLATRKYLLQAKAQNAVLGLEARARELWGDDWKSHAASA